MGERKAISKYIPPNFDPTKNLRKAKPHIGQNTIRFMFPFSVKCSNCGNVMMQATKTNARKELCIGEDYLGVKVYRLCVHCKTCYAEIILKTDPKNLDYCIERGGSRCFEPWRDYELKQKELDQIETFEMKINKEIEADFVQTSELAEMAKQRKHLRRPKLSDIKKLYKTNDTIDNSLTLNDRKLIREFTPSLQQPNFTKNERIQLSTPKQKNFFDHDSDNS